jgi:hypothetical protein
MMAAKKESTITNNMTVIGDSAMGMTQQQAEEAHLTLMSWVHAPFSTKVVFQAATKQ